MTFWRRAYVPDGSEALRQSIEQRSEVSALAHETRTLIDTLRRMNKENHYAERLEMALGGGGN